MPKSEKRRPFPSLYRAQQKYGNKIFFKPPDFVQPKHCRWCGKPLSGRRTSFCSDDCSNMFAFRTVWLRGRDPYSLRILFRDNFTCQNCGTFHAFKNEYGVFCPIDDGQLNVHHIVPVSEGGGDEPENLVTLCVECHRQIHKELRGRITENGEK